MCAKLRTGRMVVKTTTKTKSTSTATSVYEKAGEGLVSNISKSVIEKQKQKQKQKVKENADSLGYSLKNQNPF